jgi:serine/threonine protein kinase
MRSFNVTLCIYSFRLSGVYFSMDLSNLSLCGAISDHMIHFFSASHVNLSNNFLSGTLSLAAIRFDFHIVVELNVPSNVIILFVFNRYICSARAKGLEIVLSGNKGLELPFDLGHLGSEITNLNLSDCSLVKTIPASIDQFAQGTLVNLSNNKLTGELPLGIVRLASVMQTSNIFDSLALLCNSISLSTGNKQVFLENNLGFTLPKDLQEIAANVDSLNLSNCCLSGPVPENLCQLVNAKSIDISNNLFTGVLSLKVITYICNLRAKGRFFNLKENGKLTLPDDIGNLNDFCLQIDLSSCCLYGHLPPSICSLVKMDFFSLENNSLSGEIPLGFLKLIIQLRKDGKVVNLRDAGAFTLPTNLTTLPLVFDRSMSTRFKRVDLSYCSLVGPIPASFSSFRASGVMDLDISGNNFSELLPLSLVRLTNLVSITLNIDGTEGSKIDYKTLQRYLLRDIASGAYDNSIHLVSKELIDDPDKLLFKAIVSSHFPGLEEHLRRLIGLNTSLLLNAADMDGVRCIDVAHPCMSLAMMSGTFFCWRYDISPGEPLHKSPRSLVFEAKDRGYEFKLRKFFCVSLHEKRSLTNSDVTAALVEISLIDADTVTTLKSLNIPKDFPATEKNFITLCEKFIKLNYSADLIPTIAIKFCSSNEYFVRDTMIRSSNQFDERFVIDVIKDDDPKTLSDAVQYYEYFRNGTVVDFPHVMIFQKSGNTLRTTIESRNLSETDIKHLLCQFGEAIHHVHEKGVMHGDIRSDNAICYRGSAGTPEESIDYVSLIDFSASGRFLPSPNSNLSFSNEYVGARYDSDMKLPPEAFFKLSSKDERSYLQYWGVSSMPGEIKPIKSKKGLFVPKVFDIEAINMDGSALVKSPSVLPYKLLSASPLVDVWAYGILMLEILGDGARLIAESGLDSNIALWTDQEISLNIVKKIDNPLLSDLLRQVLVTDPQKRLQSISRILEHPYMGYTRSPDALGSKTGQHTIQMYRTIEDKRKRANEEKLNLRDISKDNLEKIRSTERILRKTVFPAEFESQIPTCLVILNHKVNEYVATSEDPAKIKSIAWGRKVAQLVTALSDLGKLPYFFDAENQIHVPTDSSTSLSAELSIKLSNITHAIKNLFVDESEFYLYLVDEFSMKLLSDNPFCISNADIIPRILPLFQLSLRAIASLKGVEAVAGVLAIPCGIKEDKYGNKEGFSVDSCVLDICKCVDSTSDDLNILLREYDLLVKSALPPSIPSDDPFKARLYPLTEVEHLHASTGDTGYHGLRKVVIADSCVCWTKLSLFDLSKKESLVPSVVAGAVSTASSAANQTLVSGSVTVTIPSSSRGAESFSRQENYTSVATIDEKIDQRKIADPVINEEAEIIDPSFDYTGEQDNNPAFDEEELGQGLHDVFLKVIKLGVVLKLQSAKHAFPKEVRLKLESDGCLTWKPTSKSVIRTNKTKRLELKKVTQVEYGKRQEGFQKAKNVSESLCFALISPERTLCFQASSKPERDSLSEGFTKLVNTYLEDELNIEVEPSAAMLRMLSKRSTNTIIEYREIPSKLISYSTRNDYEGTSGKQSVQNLGNDGTESWNKWYSGAESVKNDTDRAVISIEFSSPQVVNRYSLRSANDSPNRNPKAWSLWGKAVGYEDFELLHEVKSEEFSDFWQVKSYDIVPIVGGKDFGQTSFVALELRITANAKPGDGIQLGQLIFSRIGSTHQPFVDTQAHSISEVSPSMSKPASKTSTAAAARSLSPQGVASGPAKPHTSLFGWGAKAHKVRNKYVSGDPDSHPHIEEHAAAIDDNIHYPIKYSVNQGKTPAPIRPTGSYASRLPNDPITISLQLGGTTLTPDATISISETDEYSQIPGEVVYFSTDNDYEGTSGKQSVQNLGNDGTESWNKWYSGAESVKNDTDRAVISIEFSSPQVVNRYSLRSANDSPNRNPKAWSLWGKAVGYEDFELLHEVKSEEFSDFWQVKSYDIVPIVGGKDFGQTSFVALELRITANAKPGDGIQLGQLTFSRRNSSTGYSMNLADSMTGSITARNEKLKYQDVDEHDNISVSEIF